MNDEDSQKALRNILLHTLDACGAMFSGIGVIVTDEPKKLPVLPMRPSSVPPTGLDTFKVLESISTLRSEYHDGFHILSSDLRVTHVALYFSPPIVHAVVLDRTRRFGGRYVAALFGSTLPDVLMTGIASRDFGISVFERGVEKIFEPRR